MKRYGEAAAREALLNDCYIRGYFASYRIMSADHETLGYITSSLFSKLWKKNTITRTHSAGPYEYYSYNWKAASARVKEAVTEAFRTIGMISDLEITDIPATQTVEKKRYWFSNGNGEIVGNDVVAETIEPAEEQAQKIANEINETVYVNYDEDIVDVVYPDCATNTEAQENENTHKGEENNMTFTITYKKNSTYQVIAVNAANATQAAAYFREYKPNAEFIGITEGVENKPGLPSITVPHGWEASQETQDTNEENAAQEVTQGAENEEGTTMSTADHITIDAKFDALKNHLIETGACTVEEIEEETIATTYNSDWNVFEILGNEYRVLTEEEADEAAKEAILESLWAFNADFILQHTEFYVNSSVREDAAFTKALTEMQDSICEGTNPIVKALISDLDQFVQDAIDSDGRGNFLSSYDGEEHETGYFYIYQTN